MAISATKFLDFNKNNELIYSFSKSERSSTKKDDEAENIQVKLMADLANSVINANNLIKELEKEKKEFLELKGEMRKNIDECSCKLEIVESKCLKYETIILNESKTSELLSAFSWVAIIATTALFFIAPAVMELIILLYDTNTTVSEINKFYSGWKPVVFFGCGAVASTGILNLYRMISRLKERVKNLENA